MNNLKEKIEWYEQQILPQQRQRLEELKMKHYALVTRQDQNRVQNIISKWWINYQKNDLEAWILYHEEKLQNWKNQYHE